MNDARTSSLPRRIPQNGAWHWVGRVAVFAIPLGYLLFRVVGLTSFLGGGWSNSGLGLLADALIIALAVMGVNLITGYTGQLSIGHAAFFALGAYTGLVLTEGRISTPFFGEDNIWSPGWTIPVAAALCFVVGCAVGLPALRLKGIYLALTTLVFVEATRSLLKWEKLEGITGGATGIKGNKYTPPPWAESIGLEGRGDLNQWMIYLSLTLLLLVMFLVAGLMRSRIGRAMVATRDSELAAEVMGVNLAVIKTVVFGLSGAITGIGGALFGLKLGLVDGDVPLFGLFGAITFLVAMVVGGAAQIWGPLVGAVFYVFVNEFARSVGERPDDFGWVFTSFTVVVILGAIALGVRWVMQHREQVQALTAQPPVWIAKVVGTVVVVAVGLFVVARVAGGVGDRKLDGLGGVIFGILLILFARFAPYGAVGTFRLLRSKIVQIVPKPPRGWIAADGPPASDGA